MSDISRGSKKVVKDQEIILRADSKFPKKIILIKDNYKVSEYRLVKTRFGKLALNK